MLTGRRNYETPSILYAEKEIYEGIKIRRILNTGFGKASKFGRAADFFSFLSSLLIKLIFTPSQDAVVGLTSPPLIAVAGNIFSQVKGGRFYYWVMDMNPDEAIAAGWLKKNSLTAKVLTFLTKWSFKKSFQIIALDRFMKKRIVETYEINPSKISILPPWSFDHSIHPIGKKENAFVKKQGWENKFIVMYAGNHSPCHSLQTMLDAALLLRNDPDIKFCFIGGGSRIGDVSSFKEMHHLENIHQFKHISLSELNEPLNAADLHVTVMGPEYIGIVHPCKIYGILSTGKPFVFIGSKQSHMGEIIERFGLGNQVDYGNPKELVKVIRKTQSLNEQQKKEILEKSLKIKNENFSEDLLCGELSRLIMKEKAHA